MTDVANTGRARKKDTTPLAARPEVLFRIHPEDRERAAALTAGSPEVVRWLCEDEGHYAPAQIRTRLKQNRRCVYCSNKAVLVGFNDVATKAPSLVKEWHPTRNGDKTPQDFTFGSPEVVWWRCDKEHEWPAPIRQRVGAKGRAGTGCGECKGRRVKNVDDSGRIIITEGRHLLNAWPDVTGWWSEENPVHADEAYEGESKTTYQFVCPRGHAFTATPVAMLARKDKCRICTFREVAPGINTLDVTHPHYAKEWDDEKNSIPASRVTQRTRDVFHWTCSKGHSYPTTPYTRVKNNTGCHYCEGRAVLSGFNDLATVYPNYLAEWDDERDPATVYKHSSKPADWKCRQEHRWPATVYERIVGGTNCPYCDGKKAIAGVNDIATTHPDIAAQWLQSSNGDLTPQDVTITSGREAWWRVETCGHEWKGQIRYRTSAACAPCQRGEAITGVNDVLTLRPDLAAYFDAEANPDLSLARLVAGSSRVANWKCPTCAHTWPNQIRHTVGYDEPCPRCDGREVTPGVNDAATLHPHLLNQVDEDVQPASVLVGMTPSNGARIAWKCEKEHKWSTRLVDRVNYNTECPDCMAEKWSSRGEDEVAAYVESLGLAVERAKRLHKGTRHNYDMYVPKCDTYIEFNGLYFHCEAVGKGRDYHASKLRRVQEEGATLLTVWEDDWRYKPETVKRFLAHKLGASAQPKTYARATSVTTLDSASAAAFLREHHIQGPVGAGLRFALLDQCDEVVALMLLRIQGGEATIQRYATSRLVPGGFGKLLSHAKRHLSEHNPQVTHIKTFSDNLISDGDLYAAAGFTNDGQVPPDYTYFRGRGPRMHKFNFRLARFQKDPALKYEEGLSESQLATLNKFHRIWDAGKTRWMLPLASSDDPFIPEGEDAGRMGGL